jgi:hypothetical protein
MPIYRWGAKKMVGPVKGKIIHVFSSRERLSDFLNSDLTYKGVRIKPRNIKD